MTPNLGKPSFQGTNNGLSFQLRDGSYTSHKELAEFDGFTANLMRQLDTLHRQVAELRRSGEGKTAIEMRMRELPFMFESVTMYLEKVKEIP